MKEQGQSKTLGDALLLECARVRKLITQYRDPIMNGGGEIAALMMEQSLAVADYAMVSGDVIAMIRAYEDLKGYSE